MYKFVFGSYLYFEIRLEGCFNLNSPIYTVLLIVSSVIFCCEKEYKKQKKRKRVKRTLLRTLIFEDQIIKINYNLLSAFLIKLSTVIP